MICVVSTALSHDKKIALNSKYSQDCKEFEYRLKYFRLNLNFLVAFLDAFSIPISNRKFFEIKVHEKQKVKVRLKSMPFPNTSRVIPLIGHQKVVTQIKLVAPYTIWPKNPQYTYSRCLIY